jgi:L-ribulose-5-phosphate 3-epimerase
MARLFFRESGWKRCLLRVNVRRKKAMKKSVNGWMIGGFMNETPVPEQMKIAKEMGYDAIELCFGAGEFGPETSPQTLAAMKSAAAETDIEVASLATGFYWGKSLGTPVEEERREAIEFTISYLRAAAAVGAGAVLVIPGSVDVCFDPERPVVPAAVVYEKAQESLRELIPAAEETGVVIALENVWSKFLTGPFEYAGFIDACDSPFVKAYFDAGNCLINGYPEHWISILGNRIARVHVKNFTRRDGGGTLNDFTTSLLAGDVDWAKVISALLEIGYDSYLTTEVIVGDKGMPDLDQARAVEKELANIINRHRLGSIAE